MKQEREGVQKHPHNNQDSTGSKLTAMVQKEKRKKNTGLFFEYLKMSTKILILLPFENWLKKRREEKTSIELICITVQFTPREDFACDPNNNNNNNKPQGLI